ncbi:Tyrosine recombinase XerC [Dirofilaria immitis]
MNFLSTHIGGEANIGSLERLSVPELRSWLSFRYARGEPWVVKREIAIIVLLYGAGLRISEALDLKQ